jgi:dCTP deaminase
MIFTEKKILECIETGQIAIAPFRYEQLNPNSYDVTLGHWFYYVKLVDGERTYFGPKWLETGARVPLPFGVGILGMTAERIETYGNIVAQLRAKSTTGREFWTVCQDAGLGDCGYKNFWCAEFSNHLLGTAYMTVGQRFGQIVFHASTEADEFYTGQYAADDWPGCMIPKKYRDKVCPWDDDTMHICTG